MPDTVLLLAYALGGACIASFLSFIPALHIYNVAGLLLFGGIVGTVLPPEPTAFLCIGMAVGYTMFNTVSGVLFSAPDESMLFSILPAQRYLLEGRGFEAIVLTNSGGLTGLVIILLLIPVASTWLPAIRSIVQPHLAWILWAVIAYMLLSEWPKGTARAPAGFSRWWDGWKSLTAGLVTFVLSGLLGFILMYRPLVRIEVAYQGMLPAFIGLFAMPWILQNLTSRIALPKQQATDTVDMPVSSLLRGTLAGGAGGLFAAIFPVITGGIGGLLAGHATAQRDERTFLISQGTSKVLYYVGGLLLFFVPGLHLTRGGMAWMISTQYSAYTPEEYYLASAATILAGVISFLLSLLVARIGLSLINHIGYRGSNILALCIVLTVIIVITGVEGLAICAVATGIGMIPVLWGSRRSNAMGILLLPIACNVAGFGDVIARWLGLL